jgi:hypothetical protein
LGGAAVIEEATPKPSAQWPIAKEMHKAENAQDKNNRGMRAIMVMK